MIIDHMGIAVSDVERSKAFFSQALAPLEIVQIMEAGGWVGYGRGGKPEFWFGAGDEPQRPMHLAFAADSRAAVRAIW